MNAYTRSTRECTFADLRPELVTAIRKHIEKYKLEDRQHPRPGKQVFSQMTLRPFPQA